ncbi:endolysin [Arthrobacter phage Prairie]|uniref:Endolysin n=1 Tax=Arthrobacter phage Prairie TaxID=2816463 RepID=A0A8A5LUD3_9CAUD|nr:endolysin [Arthrobacter phage Prairie]
MTNRAQENWINNAVGRAIDPDRAFGLQCVDVADDYAMACFPGVPWQKSLGGVGGARDLRRVNNAYFKWVPNIVGDHKSVPARGDVIIWDGSALNPYGHVAVVLSATPSTVTVIQQDGFMQVRAHIATLGYENPGTGPALGWLRPQVKPDPVAPKPVRVVREVGPYGANERSSTTNGPGTLRRKFKKGDKLTFKGYRLGTDPYKDGNNVWFVGAFSGTYFHSSGFVGGKNVSGLPKI